MAKKKEKDEEGSLSIVDAVMKGIRKDYGEVFHSAKDIVDYSPTLVSISPKIDHMIKGGIPEGICATFSGKPGSGKTTTALTLAANAQKLGKTVYFISVEGRITRKDLSGIEGLDLSPDKFVIVESTEEKILTGNDFLDITLRIINQHKGCVVIFDSLSAISDSQEVANGVNHQARGSAAKVASTFSRQTTQTVKVNKTILILILHIQTVQGAVMSYQDEKVADTIKYLRSLEMRIKKFEPWTVGSGENEQQIGQKIQWEVKKNPLGPPGRKTESFLRYGIGIDKVAEICGLAEEFGLIDKAGSWYTLDFVESDKKPKAQGENGLYDLFRNDKKLFEELETKVKELLS